MRPPGPVCGVTSFMPKMDLARSAASAGDFASFTPPALPRPPAWICAFTTTILVRSRDHFPPRCRHTKPPEDFLRLIFVNLHVHLSVLEFTCSRNYKVYR